MSEQSLVAEFRRSFKVGKFTVTMCVATVAGKPAGMRSNLGEVTARYGEVGKVPHPGGHCHESA